MDHLGGGKGIKMNGVRTMYRTILILAAVLSLAAIIAVGCTRADSSPKEQSGQKQSASVAVAASASEKPDRVMVYYFHSTRRCKTCTGIQQTIEETIRTRFANEIAGGFLTYKDVNIEEPANKHFVEEYQISFSTMIVASMKGDRRLKWENCEKVWDFAHDQPKLADYAAERIGAYLKFLEAK
jgi:hypothetical protein